MACNTCKQDKILKNKNNQNINVQARHLRLLFLNSSYIYITCDFPLFFTRPHKLVALNIIVRK